MRLLFCHVGGRLKWTILGAEAESMGEEQTGTVAPGGAGGLGGWGGGPGARKPEVTPAAPLQHHAGHASALRQPY